MGKRTAQLDPAAPLRLFAIVHTNAPGAPGGWHPTDPRQGRSVEAVHAFTSEADAWTFLLAPFPGDPAHERAMRTGWRVVPLIAIAPPPPRETAWGPGQNDYVELSPGVHAALRITPEGRVKLTIPGGELDVTDGSSALGSGLHEAGARAAQIRVRREERRRKRALRTERALCGKRARRAAGETGLCPPHRKLAATQASGGGTAP
jgi:hypothetical protein